MLPKHVGYVIYVAIMVMMSNNKMTINKRTVNIAIFFDYIKRNNSF